MKNGNYSGQVCALVAQTVREPENGRSKPPSRSDFHGLAVVTVKVLSSCENV